ncbi:MAG TPA: hydrogenase maturation nickel metallochaperone HypA [Immundisolibacter sp.]|nr:hydrogenase maturation nickel metallochaperone HypA [Immundisolibacter sp.]
MHEHSLIANLLHRIEAVARQENARRVVGVKVWLGALCHISASHFREHFEDGSRGSLAQGARLDIEVSDDPEHPQAQDILLRSIEVG